MFSPFNIGPYDSQKKIHKKIQGGGGRFFWVAIIYVYPCLLTQKLLITSLDHAPSYARDMVADIAQRPVPCEHLAALIHSKSENINIQKIKSFRFIYSKQYSQDGVTRNFKRY